MNGAPQLFFQRAQSLRLRRGPARGTQRRAEQKIYPALAAYRREVRRTRSLPVWQNSNVRVVRGGFSGWPQRNKFKLRGAHRWRERGLRI